MKTFNWKERYQDAPPRIYLILTILFSLILAIPSKAQVQTSPIDVQAAVPEGGSAAPLQLTFATSWQGNQPYKGLKVAFQHAYTWNALMFPAGNQVNQPIDVTEYRYLSFRVNFDTVDEQYHDFSIRVRDMVGNWGATAFSTHATRLPDGSYQFIWEIPNHLDVNLNFDPTKLGVIDFIYNYPAIPVNGEVVATFSRMHLSREPVTDTVLSSSIVAGYDPAMQLQNVSIQRDGMVIPGLEATLQPATTTPALYIPTEIADATKFNTLEFRVKFSDPDENSHLFGVRMLSTWGAWAGTDSYKHTTRLPDGSYLFSWDILNEPDYDYGINLEDVRRLEIFYYYPSANAETVTLSDMNFIAGRAPRVGDPILWPQWLDYIENYAPDYSDSSSALEPPLTGRIATPLSLTSNGQALGEIVLGATSSDVETNAAKELQHWIKEISGAELPIVSPATGTNNIKLLIGRSFAETAYSADIATLDGSDGYAVRTSGNSVYIFGAKPKGTMNGVFTFIENNSDLIWARPHPDYGTIFSKNPNFSVVWGDACDRPVGVVRGPFWNAGGWDGRNALWSDRNRNNHSYGDLARNAQWGDRMEAGGGHNLHTLIPANDPLYYPTINGQKPAVLSIWAHQICMSVPGLAHTMAQKVVTAIQALPVVPDVFNIKIEDNWGVCECIDCTAPISLPGGETLTLNDPEFRSTQFYKLLNDVTAEVNLTYPNLKTQTYAYFFTAVPPKVALNPNIYVLFCPYVRKDHRTPLSSPINDHWWKMLKGFAQQTPNVFVREYYGILNQGRPLAEVVAADFKSYVDMGVKSIGAETHNDFLGMWWTGGLIGAGDEFDLNMMDYWILNRIYWNPNVDVEALRKYFLRRTFHEAAPQMEKFFGVIRKKWYEKIRPASDWGNFKAMIEESVLIPGREAEMRGYLASAASVATNPVSRVLISRLENRFSETVSQIQNPVPPDNSWTPVKSFRYGWDCNTGCNVYATTIELNGNFVPALHVTAKHPISPYGPDLWCDFPYDLTGKELKFIVIPKDPATTMSGPLMALITNGFNNNGEEAPNTAYTSSPVAPGALQFQWPLTGLNPSGQPIDLTNGGLLRVFFDRNSTPPAVPPEGLDFYIVDFSALPASP